MVSKYTLIITKIIYGTTETDLGNSIAGHIK